LAVIFVLFLLASSLASQLLQGTRFLQR